MKTKQQIINDYAHDWKSEFFDQFTMRDMLSSFLKDTEKIDKESKEEPSQRIMMEQVDKLEDDFCEEYGKVKQDKPEEEDKINWDIDVRYEKDVIKAFDKFIEKWCGNNSAHLLDSDEQDGQFMRDKIQELLKSPIEDTNKTSLEVPKKIEYNSDRFGHDIVIDRINELIDYLTLISLKERK